MLQQVNGLGQVRSFDGRMAADREWHLLAFVAFFLSFIPVEQLIET
jgi:hypothetical protein